MDRFNEYLGDINHLLDTSTDDKGKAYVHPVMKNLGSVSIVLVREAVAPVVFRNAEEEITDIELSDGGDPYIRAVPNKFKYPERGRGLQILRLFKAGGRMPQNKTALAKGQAQSEGFDLNALVFGDSAVQDGRVLPVKAAVNYSDALSILPKHLCVDESFHNRAFEDGSLFDPKEKKNSDNLFTRHFVKPGTLMVQVLSTRGKLLPRIGLDHLLLCLGVAGTYGGQTSVTGTNIRTHIAGIYGGRFEQAESSPYKLVKKLNGASSAEGLIEQLHGILEAVHEVSMPAADAQAYQNALMQRFEHDTAGLQADYQAAAKKVGELFDQWFGK